MVNKEDSGKMTYMQDANTEIDNETQTQEVREKSVMESDPETYRFKRTRLQIESEGTTPQTLRDFINFLKTSKFDPDKEFYEFEIPVAIFPISPEDIKELTEFPFEFQLLQRDENIVVSTGAREQPHAEEQDTQEKRDTKLYFHTHPSKKPFVNTPSFSDLALTTKDDSQLILAYPGGLMIFRRPIYNPLTQMYSLDDVREILLHYCEAKGIEIFDQPHKGLRSFFDLTDEEQVQFQRQFAEETRMILREVSWNDKDGVAEIIDVVNLRKSIDHNYPIIPSCLDTLDLKALSEDQRKNVSTLGGLIDAITNKYGIFGTSHPQTDSYLEFIKDTLTNDLSKKGITEEYKRFLEQLLIEVDKLKAST